MEPQFSVTFDCGSLYEVALLTVVHSLLQRDRAGREEAEDVLCSDCYAHLKAEVDAALAGELAGVLGEQDVRVQSSGQEN